MSMASGETVTLQWGRGFAATEGVGVLKSRLGRLAASMGPWLCSHGRGNVEVVRAVLSVASMGPWLCSHGRSAEATSSAVS